jgi:hypothetical protein
MPLLLCVIKYSARNHLLNGSLVEWKIVPAVSDTCFRQALH